MTAPLKIAVAGLGVVGAETVRLIAAQHDVLARRGGRPLVVTAVSARDKNRDRGVSFDGIEWFDDPVAMARSADADVICELIGGSDGVARDVCEVAIAAGRHVVTANKALIAMHGASLGRDAEAAKRTLAYEAAVAGGIPIIKALREGLAANQVTRLQGILNGTCNYILTVMRESGRDFAEILAEAQAHGYAEADPSFDIDGVDAAHKLAILTSVAFGCEIDFDAVHIEGIRHIDAQDIRFATELGYRIKLLGIAEMTEAGVQQRVHPAMVPLEAPIASVEGVFNGVVAEGDFVGTTMFEGRGAGAGPTASAVVADIVDIARGRETPTYGVPADALQAMRVMPMDERVGLYFVRVMVYDKPGVFADIAGALRDSEISIESAIQRSRSEGGVVPVVLTTHETKEASMRHALNLIGALDSVAEAPRMIRIETP
ncbi:MAG: homoserine dehydrogenase [Alphaproteobacteria bacterium]|nr:homoserine dehydrogenase [Alphaproteobacteria bacterium]